MPLFRDTTAGGAFADRIRKASEHKPASEPPPKPSHLHEHRLAREPVYANATLVHAHGKVSAVVTNINALGVRVEFTTHVPLQGDIVVHAPVLGLNRNTRVAWQKAGSAGLIFKKQEPASA